MHIPEARAKGDDFWCFFQLRASKRGVEGNGMRSERGIRLSGKHKALWSDLSATVGPQRVIIIYLKLIYP